VSGFFGSCEAEETRLAVDGYVFDMRKLRELADDRTMIAVNEAHIDLHAKALSICW
tara:strand:+ start:209 stop:376 length:168 start_codon:yes stop_codon:yes gene_type:complete